MGKPKYKARKTPNDKRPRCHKCNGYGVVREKRQTSMRGLTTTQVIICDRCNGTKVEPRFDNGGV